jgi:hypothetical protein
MTTVPQQGDTIRGLLLDDDYGSDLPPGEVVGSLVRSGGRRLGVDRERLIGIDHGALRLRPLAAPGWGNEGVAYGPFSAQPGLVLAAQVLNGHNASQTFYFPQHGRELLRSWVSEARRGRFRRPRHHENLAVGLFSEAVPRQPLRSAHSFVMHAATEDNGELWGAFGGQAARLVRGVQNIPFLYVVALRADGAATYYTSSISGATGAAGHPMLRPLGVSRPVRGVTEWYAGFQQRILGEVGYRVDTRVDHTRVAVLPEWAGRWGSARLADTLVGGGSVAGSPAEVGGDWQGDGGSMVRSAWGARSASDRPARAWLVCDTPVGLVRAAIGSQGDGHVELRWRSAMSPSSTSVRLDGSACTVLDASDRVLVRDVGLRLGRRCQRDVQIFDDGTRLAVRVDGVLAGGRFLPCSPPEPGPTVLELTVAGAAGVTEIEAHAAETLIPASIDLGAGWRPPASKVLIDERFDLVAENLAGTCTPSAGRRWELSEGCGAIELRGGEARVKADREHPNPGRTVFTIPSPEPDFAELCVEMTPPGTARGQGENGRVGVIFWQDADNYLVVNVYVDDDFDGASISTFYHLDGYEQMYDAVWTLVRGVTWGQRCRLRVAFDGHRFLAWANDEPSLVRALTDVYPSARPLRIQRVGLIVNEEWGDDTGTVLHRFTVGGRAPCVEI